MVTIDDGLPIRVNGQKESPSSAANPQLFCAKQKVSVALKAEFVRRRCVLMYFGEGTAAVPRRDWKTAD